jgi:solute:Na+ symporter, SSS family
VSALDWLVLIGTTSFIVGWGVWKSRGARTATEFLRGGNELRWPTIGLSVMATQASAITFLSVPGQAYEDGMRFGQFYFGLPIAMIVISAVFVPIYYRLKVYTAYELLESRFDAKTRVLGAGLFLIQRGLAAGITIYAPAIILSTILGWPLEPTILVIGTVVIGYTVSGGAKAVAQTQKQQMVVMLAGMCVAGVVIVTQLPDEVSMAEAVGVAGALGRMNLVSFELDLESRYNFWSGITGGFFLALAYFGTDQSQVGRYLTGRSIAESRLGLLFNGMLKIPMQLGILFVGVLMFALYQWSPPPLLFNDSLRARVERTEHEPALAQIEARWAEAHEEKRAAVERWLAARDETSREELRARARAMDELRAEAKAVVKRAAPSAEVKDSDYIFIGFVKQRLPSGLFGLLVAVILAAAMSSVAGELTALGATTTVDVYRRLVDPSASDRRVLLVSKGFTVLWGVVAISFASFASLLDNLIQAVNILGSIFYGTVLGIFLVAFFVRRVQGHAVFAGAVLSQLGVIALFFLTDIGYLWFNVIGCAGVVALASMLQLATRQPPPAPPPAAM